MAVAFQPGQTIGRGDLDIFPQDSSGVPINVAEIYFTLYWVDPGPPETEVLVGATQRVPINPAVGEYYASLAIPSDANLGTYRIRWTFKETVSSAPLQVAQEFAVVSSASSTSTNYTQAQSQMMWSLRVLLRDQCVGGEETVELDVGGERMVVRMDDLWEALQDIPPPT